MDIKLLHIEAQESSHLQDGDYPVEVRLEIDGVPHTFTLTIMPGAIPELGAGLIVPSPLMEDRFRVEQYALHRICRLVGKHLHGESVRLPRQIAA